MFDMMKNDGTIYVSAEEIANFKGQIKVFAYENYRNGFAKFKELDDKNKSTEEKLDFLSKKTLENNKDVDSLRKEIVENFNIADKWFTAIDVAHLVKCDPDSEMMKGLENLYKDDERFIDFIYNLKHFAVDMKRSNVSQETFDAGLKQFFKKYFVIIGGNTRFFILRDEYKKNLKEGILNGNEKKKQYPFCLYNFERLEDQNGDITKVNLKKVVGLSELGKTKYYFYHYMYLLFMIINDNKNEAKNVKFEYESYARGYLIQLLTKNKDFYNGKDFDVRALPEIYKFFFKMARGFNAKAITHALVYQALHDMNNGTLTKNGDSFVYDEEDLTYCAKCASLLIESKFKSDKNSKKKVRNLIGLDYETAKLVELKKLNDFLELTVKLHKAYGCQPASEPCSRVVKPLLEEKYSNDSFELTTNDKKRILREARVDSANELKKIEDAIDRYLNGEATKEDKKYLRRAKEIIAEKKEVK